MVLICGRKSGAAAVHFEPDRLSVVFAKLAHLAQRLADLLERFLDRHFLGQSVGPHLDAGGAHIPGQQDVFPRGLDVLPQLRLVRGVIIKRAAQAEQFHFGIREALLHLGPLFPGEVYLNFVRVRRAQFDALEPGCLAVLDDRGDIPVRRQVVGDQAQVHFGRPGELRGRSARGGYAQGEGAYGCGGRAAQKLSSIHNFSSVLADWAMVESAGFGLQPNIAGISCVSRETLFPQASIPRRFRLQTCRPAMPSAWRRCR